MELNNAKILILLGEDFEDLELFYPKYRMTEAGAKVVVAGIKAGEKYKSKHEYPCQADISFDDVKVSDFSALIIPGGFAPDKLRKIPKVLEIVKQFNADKKLIAYICHAGWVLISAKVIEGVKCTSYDTLKDDMINAGANWVDEAVVVDRNIISSRRPDDLPVFCKAILKYLHEH
jgi:protease I